MTDKRLEIILAAKDLTGKAFGTASGHIRRITKEVFSLQGAFATLAGGYGLGKIAGSFLDAARTTENYRVRLKVLLGSVEEGNRLFREMDTYTSRVPFDIQEIMESATQLAGVMKGGVNEVKQWMPLIGDLAAASGLGIRQTTEQIIKMYSAGAAAADMLRDRGISAMLGFQTGVHYSAEETRKQLMAAWQDPASKFSGAAKELAKTWDGAMSMMRDKWFRFRNSVMAAGVYDELKTQLAELNAESQKWLETNREIIRQKVPEYVKDIKESLAGAVAVYTSLPDGVVGAAGAGIVGRVLFGSTPAGVMTAALVELNTLLSRFNLNIGSLPGKYNELGGAVRNITDALTGRRDWRTGAELINAAGGQVVHGKIPKPPPLPSPAGRHGPSSPDMTAYYKAQLKEWNKVTDDFAAAEKTAWKKITDDYLRSQAALSETVARYQAEAEASIRAVVPNMADELDRALADPDKYFGEIKKTGEETFKDLSNAMSGWARNWSATLNDMVWGAKTSFGDILESFGRMVTQMMIQKSVIEPLTSSVFEPLSKSVGGFFKGIFQHRAAGGPVYAGRPYVVGERGPELFFPGRTGAIAPSAGGVTVNIINNTPSRVEAREGYSASGGKRLDILIDEAVAQRIGAGGKTFQAIRRTFGINPPAFGR